MAHASRSFESTSIFDAPTSSDHLRYELHGLPLHEGARYSGWYGRVRLSRSSRGRLIGRATRCGLAARLTTPGKRPALLPELRPLF